MCILWILGTAASFSESDSDRFRFVYFLFEEAISSVCSMLVRCATTQYKSNLFGEIIKRETHSTWLRRGYRTSILKVGVGFGVLASFRFLVDITFYRTFFNSGQNLIFLMQLTLSHCLLAHKIKRVESLQQM